DGEVGLMGERGAAVAYCPSSNMFLGDGITRLPELLRAGVRVGLGTDGGCTNNRLSVFEEMRMASLLARVRLLDGSALDAAPADGPVQKRRLRHVAPGRHRRLGPRRARGGGWPPDPDVAGDDRG